MRHLSIRTRLLAVLLAGVVAAIAIMTVSFALTRSGLDDLQARASALTQLQRMAGRFEEAIHDENDAIDNYLLEGGVAGPLTLAQSARTIQATLVGAFETLARSFPAIDRDVLAIVDAMAAWRTGYVDPTLQTVAAGGLEQARQRTSLAKGDVLADAVDMAAGHLHDDLDGVTQSTLARIADISASSFAFLVVGIGILLGGALAAAFILARSVVRPIHRLLATAQAVEAGRDAVFPAERDDELGSLGGALERMRRGLYGQAVEASVINRFTELTAFVESDGDVARAALEALAELTKPLDGAIHVSNRSRDRAVPEASFGDVTPEVVSLGALSACPGVRRSGLYVTGDLSDRLAVRCPIHVATSGTLACIPLVALGEVVGAAHLHWAATDDLPLDVRGAVSRIADHASLSVANRRLVVALQGQASSDGRTGLANSRAFDAALEEALRARTVSEPLSVLMFDIDHFKTFNDRHGHPAGDEALRAFAQVLRSCVRERDLAARYGGEEFAVMLPDMDAAAGTAIAERIRARIESTIIQLAPGITDKIAVSCGVATFPVDAMDRVELLKRADAALYEAKQTGRNRVVVADASRALGETAKPAGGRRRSRLKVAASESDAA